MLFYAIWFEMDLRVRNKIPFIEWNTYLCTFWLLIYSCSLTLLGFDNTIQPYETLLHLCYFSLIIWTRVVNHPIRISKQQRKNFYLFLCLNRQFNNLQTKSRNIWHDASKRSKLYKLQFNDTSKKVNMTMISESRERIFCTERLTLVLFCSCLSTFRRHIWAMSKSHVMNVS